VLPPNSLRELERELKLTLAALGAKTEGNGVAAEETSCSAKKDERGERKRTESVVTIGDDDDVGGGAGRNGSVDVDVDAVVGALAEVSVGDER